jgi:hypothetical protein
MSFFLPYQTGNTTILHRKNKVITRNHLIHITKYNQA